MTGRSNRSDVGMDVGVDVTTQQVSDCPLCGHSSLSSWRNGCSDSTGLRVTLNYKKCSTCGCRVLTPRADPTKIGQFYGESYSPYVHTSTAGSLALVGQGATEGPLQTRLAEVYAATPDRRRTVLDFGCGSSTFVDAARSVGWSTVAADFAEQGLDGARQAGHECHVVDERFWKWLADQRFDVIRLSHVIEHIYDPAERMRALLGSLRPGGTLHVVTPDPDGPATSLARRHSNFFQLVHVTLIPKKSLARFAEQAGARETTFVPELTTKDMWRSWLLTWGAIASYEGAAESPSRGWQRRLLRLIGLGAAKIGRHDRYHAFIVV